MEIAAPAKINLYLRIVREMNDGYHEIETLFERISIFDNISVNPAADRTEISCNDKNIPTDGESLLGRTVEIFRQEAGYDGHLKVRVSKNIPVGAGLGGGSSDAAALLKALNGIAGCPLTGADLMRIGGVLGADVPFFVQESSFAYGKGKGDIIQAVSTDLKMGHVLVNPPFEISTKEVYGKVPGFGLTKKGGVDRMFTAFLSANDMNGITGNLRNDLQDIVLRDFPVLEQVFSEFSKAGAQGVLLSGSGPTVFGLFPVERTEDAAKKMSSVFPEEDNWRVIPAYTC